MKRKLKFKTKRALMVILVLAITTLAGSGQKHYPSHFHLVKSFYAPPMYSLLAPHENERLNRTLASSDKEAAQQTNSARKRFPQRFSFLPKGKLASQAQDESEYTGLFNEPLNKDYLSQPYYAPAQINIYTFDLPK